MPVQLMPDETAMMPASAACKFQRQRPVAKLTSRLEQINKLANPPLVPAKTE